MPDMVEAYFHNGRTYLILWKYGTKVLGHYLFEITDDTKLREIRFPQSKGEEIVAMKLKDGGGDLIVEAEVTPKVRGIRFQTGCYEYFKISNGKSTKIHDTFTYEDPTINKWAWEWAMKGIHLKDTKKAYG